MISIQEINYFRLNLHPDLMMAMIFHTARAARSSTESQRNSESTISYHTNKPKRLKYQTRPSKNKNTSTFKTIQERWRGKTKNNQSGHSFLSITNKLQLLKFKRNDDCPDIFLTLDEYVVDNIFRFLNYSDLISLSKTSKALLFKVQQFALHHVESHLRMEKLDKFFTSGILTYEERIIKNRLNRDNGPQLSTALMAFKYLDEYGQYFERASITTAVVVNRRNQFQKQRYIVRELCEPLGRDVLRVKQICGLHFQKEFDDVPPGIYQVSLHLQIKVDLERSGRPRRWNNNCTVIISVRLQDENSDSSVVTLANAAIEPHYWKLIQKDKFNNDLLDGNATITKEENIFPFQTNDWFYIKLTPFRLKNKSNNLIFVWTEIESNDWKNSGRWKEGMCWDFVQIQGVN